METLTWPPAPNEPSGVPSDIRRTSVNGRLGTAIATSAPPSGNAPATTVGTVPNGTVPVIDATGTTTRPGAALATAGSPAITARSNARRTSVRRAGPPQVV